MKRITDIMLQIEPGAMNQVPVSIYAIRAVSGRTRTDFNTEMIQLVKSGEIEVCSPRTGPMTEMERNHLLAMDGTIFTQAIILRVMPVKQDAVDRMPVDQISQTESDQPGVMATRGGRRPGAGRKVGVKVVRDDLKRIPLTGVRIPAWLNDWLKGRGNAGTLIESALIEVHKLAPPD